jgi:hypothetical protein
MSYLDDPQAEMSTVNVEPGSVVVIQLDDVGAFAERCPEQYRAIVECSAFVNFGRLEQGEPPIIALSFCKSPR